jgi:Copper amine oxidase, enzyme domain
MSNITEELNIAVEPFGPTAVQLDEIGRTVLHHESVKKIMCEGKHRLLSVEAVDIEREDKKHSSPHEAENFIATIYDYTAMRTLIVKGRIKDPSELTVLESSLQPPVNSEEFAEAVKYLSAHPDFSQQIQSGKYVIYNPMPPLLDIQEPDGRTRRVIAVGLFSQETRTAQEILGVELPELRLHRFPDRAPHGSNPSNNSICGAPGAANQPTTSKGTAGQVWVTVKQGSQTIWRFLVVRPAASSGLRGSGIELRYVDYKGKRVLYRGHVPILNVRYDKDACGPYRDWQYEEGEIQATGTDVASGFRLCPSPAKTIMDSGSDVGNYLGVAIYVEGQEVVLVSEMQAGWYRYISQWRLNTNGTIRPRFGFAATDSPCVCNIHHHHAYWRFDFDIETAGSNRVLEFNDPPIIGSNNWHEKHFEINRPRDPGHKRKWRVENTSTGANYEIRPRKEDGVAAQQSDWPYGRGDVWVLRYHSNELDDGFNVTTSPNSDAKLDQWVNGESVLGQDVVIWYGAHFTHDVSHQDPAEHGHVVGPDLIPGKWVPS